MEQSKNRTFYFVPGRKPQCRGRRDAQERPSWKRPGMAFFNILLKRRQLRRCRGIEYQQMMFGYRLPKCGSGEL